MLSHQILKSLILLANIVILQAVSAVNFIDVDLKSLDSPEVAFPDWLIEVTESGGSFSSESGWSVGHERPFGTGKLYVSIDSSKLDTLIALSFSSPTRSNLAVQLYDASERILAVDLLAKRKQLSEEQSQTTVLIPLHEYPTAAHIVLRRLEGDIEIHSLRLAETTPAVNQEGEYLIQLAERLGDPLALESPLRSSDTFPVSTGTVSSSTIFQDYQPLLNRAQNEDRPLSESELKDIFLVLGLSGYDFNANDFVRAAGEGREEVVGLYLRAGMPVDATGKNRYTAMAEAATSGELRVLSLLCEHGADPDIKTVGGNTALRMAAFGPHLEAIRMLVDYGADLNSIGAYGKTPVQALNHERSFNYDKVDATTLYLLQKGADPDIPDNRGNSLIHDIAAFGRYSLMAEALKYSKKPNETNNFGMTPMMLAVYDNTSAMVRTLEEAGVAKWKPNFGNRNEELVYWTFKGQSKKIEEQLEQGANPNTLDFNGRPLVFKVIDMRRIDLLKLLVEHGADLDVYDPYGCSPLGRVKGAYHIRCEEMVEYLLEQGQDPNYATQAMLRKKMPYWTPLMKAAEAGNTERCQRLLIAGADPRTKNLPKRTAAEIAARAGHIHLANQLRSAEAVYVEK